MKRKQATRVILMIAAAAAIAAFTETRAASAHCDTLDGPVVMDAREALSRGDVSLVLKWVQPTDEKEITDVFTRALKVRKQGPEAREMADMHFFETLVRVHRAGEGFPYTGLKPSGADPGTAVRMADKALETGSVEELAGNTASEVGESIRKRFHRALEARKHAGESVPAGREYVEAYVSYVHYVENLHSLISSPGGHHEDASGEGGKAEHGH